MWMLAGFIATIGLAVGYGFAYPGAVALLGVGVAGHFLNVTYIHFYLRARMPDTLEDGTWLTAGLGVVPRWASALGLLTVGLIAGGVVLVALVTLGVLPR